MIDKDRLEGYKKTIQNIINRILPEDKRFSVKDFDEEWIYYLVSLFLEKDSEKRNKIYEEIKLKTVEAERMLNQAEYNFWKLNSEILVKKEEYDKIFNTIKELNSLIEDVNIEQELNSELNLF